MKKVGFYTLGCKLNFSETSAIGRQFDAQGYLRVPFHEPADVYLINTCSVTDNADKKCRKVVRQALKSNPKAFVIIVGCYAQLKPEEISMIPGVDLVLGAAEKFRMFEVVDEFVKEHAPTDKMPARILAGKISEVNEFVPAFSQGERTRSFLKVQDGCDYKCSFCTIPLARGGSRSDTLENVIANARRLADEGVKEIVLTGVNLGDFQNGQSDDFRAVVEAIDQVEGIERIRISSIEPNLLTDDIIEYVARSKRFMPHFHVPLQSGNNDMLSIMRRRYRRELYAERVAAIKKLMPHACIGVDVIVGHPGETEARFLDTYNFINDLDVSYLHVFTYSERPNTHAITLPDAVPIPVRNSRNEMLRILSEKKKRNFYSQFEGKSRLVLWEEEVDGGNIYGFTDNYIKTVAPYDPLWVNEVKPLKLLEVNAEGIMQVDLEEIAIAHHG
jgi:threonylcarbamoyladenosine tRNA methylthiotransferase MtaB